MLLTLLAETNILEQELRALEEEGENRVVEMLDLFPCVLLVELTVETEFQESLLLLEESHFVVVGQRQDGGLGIEEFDDVLKNLLFLNPITVARHSGATAPLLGHLRLQYVVFLSQGIKELLEFLVLGAVLYLH